MTHDTGAGGRGMGLTPRMAELLAYIAAREEPATLEQMRAALGLCNRSEAHRLVRALEERRRVTRHRGKVVINPPRYRFIPKVRATPQLDQCERVSGGRA